MSLDLLKGIEQAELRAEEIRSAAQHEAQDLINATEEKCAGMERKAAKEHRAIYLHALEQGETHAFAEIEKKTAGHADERAAFCQQARGRLDKAAERIVERIVGNGNR